MTDVKSIKESSDNILYPHHSDVDFNLHIRNKEEFANSEIQALKPKNKESFIEIANSICNKPFEMAPHQIFVRNFLSFHTPYNSMLLFHGLGTGKTCTSIGVAEEMRQYLKYMNINKRIIIVASPNVQENFKLQLFDERKLKETDGHWNIQDCVGNSLLQEINPTNMVGLERDKIIKMINKMISTSYLFIGYYQFANFIGRLNPNIENKQKNNKLYKKRIQNEFNDRLVVIDEIHNIRSKETKVKDTKKVPDFLMKVAKYSKNMHLLLLSATPMYNSYDEIVSLINMLLVNDKKKPLKINDIFDKNGNFKTENNQEVGKSKLMEATRGYVSFVKGENPFRFPYRMFPALFEPQRSFQTNRDLVYPTLQLNNKPIEEPLRYVDVFTLSIGKVQEIAYNAIIENHFRKELDENMAKETLGYALLQNPLEALNVVYPTDNLEIIINENKKTRIDFIGKVGFNQIINYKEIPHGKFKVKTEFAYDKSILKRIGHFFHPTIIRNYSEKIYHICETIKNSQGISLVYSQYIEGGIVPCALALEELGFQRYGDTPSLFTNEYRKQNKIPTKKLYYTIISGDKSYSPSNIEEIKAITNDDNRDGDSIKVVFISKAGSEGIDLKNIRNVFVLEPWYNMNRIEQIIGRAVRNCSHRSLPLEKRNVSIFCYGTILSKQDEEAVDLYIYRKAEQKAIQISKVTRTLKESSVDCLLNIQQNEYSVEHMNDIEIVQTLSNGKDIDYMVGDKPYSSTCDYMGKCDFQCMKCENNTIAPLHHDDKKRDFSTYNEYHIQPYQYTLLNTIKELFKRQYFYTREEINEKIALDKSLSFYELDFALDKLCNYHSNGEFVVDMLGRRGHIINVGDMYIYQPLGIDDNKISMFERMKPIDYKHEKLKLYIDDDDKVISDVKINIIEVLQTSYNDFFVGNSKYNYVFKELQTCTHQNENNEHVNFDFTIIKELFVERLFDLLSLDNKVDVINYMIENPEYDESHSFLHILYKYVKSDFLELRNMKGYLIPDETHKGKNNSYAIYVHHDGDKSWSRGGKGELDAFRKIIQNRYINNIDFAEYIGLMAINKVSTKDRSAMIFKLKKTENEKGRSLICRTWLTKYKRDLLKTNLNVTVNSDTKNNEYQVTLDPSCVLIEMVFRYYQRIKLNNKHWFIGPITTAVNEESKTIKI